MRHFPLDTTIPYMPIIPGIAQPTGPLSVSLYQTGGDPSPPVKSGYAMATPRKKPEEKLKTGPKPKYGSPQNLQKMIDAYFNVCDAGETIQQCDKSGKVTEYTRKIPYTIPGLAYHLGYANKQAIWDLRYKCKDPQIAEIASRATLKIESQRNQMMLCAQNTRGYEFDLKCNFKWVDKTQLEIGLNPEQLAQFLSVLPERVRTVVEQTIKSQAARGPKGHKAK